MKTSEQAGCSRNAKRWRSLEEWNTQDACREQINGEFPTGASEWQDKFSRRHFLKIMGASMALAGVSGCTRQPREKIGPYVSEPPEMTPGKPLYFATALTWNGFATGVIVTSREGRPVKIEGNPLHPASLGGTNAFLQARLLDLYDPDRLQTVINAGKPATWSVLLSVLNNAMLAQQKTRGAGLRILTETVTSPTLHAQLRDLLTTYPQAKWHQWEPVNRDNHHEGARMAFGKVVETHYDFEKADIILSLDSDFLSNHPAALSFARKFAKKRRVEGLPGESMNRLYVVETTPSLTGSMADHRFVAGTQEIVDLTFLLERLLGAAGETSSHWLKEVAEDLKKHSGRGIVLAGATQPPEVHAVVHSINDRLRNTGSTVWHATPAEAEPTTHLASLQDLVKDMASGKVEMLVMLGGNPIFNAPADLNFSEALESVPLRVHLTEDYNETTRLCHWAIPAAHELESWGDALAFDGTASIIQPLIEPLYDGKTRSEILDALSGQPARKAYDIVRTYWRTRLASDFEKTWRSILSTGVVPGTSLSLTTATAASPSPQVSNGDQTGLELVFRPDPTIWDGRFANNAWLQELPKPFTKLTWDNAALISPALAEREGLKNGDEIELHLENRRLDAPVWILPGHAENAVTLHLGYGRKCVGAVGAGTGYDAYALRNSRSLWSGGGLKIRRTGKRHVLSSTQQHFNTEGRDIVREGVFSDFARHPNSLFAEEKTPPSNEETLYNPNEFRYDGHKWGMSIDLNTCIGCSACIVACQAENNIPVVGKYQVSKGREMHWIRVDMYYAGDPARPSMTHQPVPCMHCENAPCEVVCPVGATVHDKEGLNVQVYNRCIGTRYCSNNCPYKVRRFNFLEFNAGMTPVQKMVKNPDVTVRSRGVMEKCTYCVQRINEVRIAAEVDNRKIHDGEILTACQAACPSEAIIFGDLNDANSRLSRLKRHPLNYQMLGELNTKPRTTYLAKLRNSNPLMTQ